MELSRYTQDCGCAFEAYASSHEWFPCPLHVAAPKLLAALEGLLLALQRQNTELLRAERNDMALDSASRDVLTEMTRADATIKEAKGN